MNHNDTSDLINFTVQLAVVVAVLIIVIGLVVCFWYPKALKFLQSALIEPAVKNWNSIPDIQTPNEKLCSDIFDFYKK